MKSKLAIMARIKGFMDQSELSFEPKEKKIIGLVIEQLKWVIDYGRDDDVKFEIFSISTEKSIDGRTEIVALARDSDRTRIRIEVPNNYLENTDQIRTSLNVAYNIAINEKINSIKLKVGDVI